MRQPLKFIDFIKIFIIFNIFDNLNTKLTFSSLTFKIIIVNSMFMFIL